MKNLNKMFPDLEKFKKKKEREDKAKKFRLRIIDVNRLDFLEKLAKRVEGYLTQIKNQNKEIEELKEKVKEKEYARRKLAGKIGGMRKEINKNGRLQENVKARK